MKNIFGLIFSFLGWFIVIFGIRSLFAHTQPFPWLGVFLVPAGEGVAFFGAVLTAHWDITPAEMRGAASSTPDLSVSKILFTVCFFCSIGVAIYGLWTIFGDGRMFQCLYLLAVGVIGAFPFALAALAQE
jgi:hypothetical protein